MSETNNNSSLLKIKSKYILKQVIGNLKIKKSLEIIRYNKILQNKLNIKINDNINIQK